MVHSATDWELCANIIFVSTNIFDLFRLMFKMNSVQYFTIHYPLALKILLLQLSQCFGGRRSRRSHFCLFYGPLGSFFYRNLFGTSCTCTVELTFLRNNKLLDRCCLPNEAIDLLRFNCRSNSWGVVPESTLQEIHQSLAKHFLQFCCGRGSCSSHNCG